MREGHWLVIFAIVLALIVGSFFALNINKGFNKIEKAISPTETKQVEERSEKLFE